MKKYKHIGITISLFLVIISFSIIVHSFTSEGNNIGQGGVNIEPINQTISRDAEKIPFKYLISYVGLLSDNEIAGNLSITIPKIAKDIEFKIVGFSEKSETKLFPSQSEKWQYNPKTVNKKIKIFEDENEAQQYKESNSNIKDIYENVNELNLGEFIAIKDLNYINENYIDYKISNSNRSEF